MAALSVAAGAWGQSLYLETRTGVRVEAGGDVRLDEATGVRRALAVTPRLSWQRRVPGWSADVDLAPSLELPPRRAGHALSRWGASGRLRRHTAGGRLGLSADVGRVDFEADSRWTGRHRLSLALQAERFVRRDLVLSLAYGYDASRYGGPSGQAGAARTDGRHGLRLGGVWFGPGRWLTAGAETLDNGSAHAAYRYRAGQAWAAAGGERGRGSAAVQVSHEARVYRASSGPAWGLTWVGLRAGWHLSPAVWLYAAAQQEWGRAGGRRLFEPWRLLETGLRVGLPLGAPPAAPTVAAAPGLTSATAPAVAGLEPHPADGAWVFRFWAAEASSVHLVGSFSGWDLEAHPMRRRAGTWETTVRLPPGIHEYAFLVDGHDWRVPPAAFYYVDDGFGRENGVVVVVADEAARQKEDGR